MVNRILLGLCFALIACTGNDIVAPSVGRPTISLPPSGSMGAGAVITITGTDVSGFIDAIVGQNPYPTGDVGIVRFATPYARAPRVSLSGGTASSTGGGLMARPLAKDVTERGFTLTTTTGYNGSGAILSYHYQVQH